MRPAFEVRLRTEALRLEGVKTLKEHVELEPKELEIATQQGRTDLFHQRPDLDIGLEIGAFAMDFGAKRRFFSAVFRRVSTLFEAVGLHRSGRVAEESRKFIRGKRQIDEGCGRIVLKARQCDAFV